MGEANYQKSYFDVLGLCCPSEVPLVEKLLQPLQGVQRVSVIVPSRTVIVVHDVHKISPSQIAKALNQARLEASVRSYGAGAGKITNIWPSPYIIVCGTLLVVSLFEHFFHPLKWLALAAAAAGLPPIVLRSFAAARRFTLDINILMLIAVAGAIALRDYSEAGFIVFLFTTAEWLETRASHKATAGMSSLMSMAPQKAVLAETGQEVEVQDVKVNTVIAVKAGEVIPIDGVVVDGRSEVDERTLTGESFPVAKQAQSQVWAGTLNIDGYITVRTTAMAEDSAVAKMARLVEESQNSRSKTQRLIDSCAKYYTPAVVVMAATVAVIPLAARAHNLRHWFQLALVLLVSACPCALVLSTPIAAFCALLRATRTGLLIKGGDVLESLARIKVAAFDKTGTITRGEFSVEEFQPVGDHASMQKLLYWVSSIESKSSHPMASALIDYSQSNSVEAKPANVTEFQIYPGEGIYGEIDGKDVYIGNKRIVSRASCETVPDAKDLKGVTIGYVISNKELVGVFTLSDACRTGSAEAIKELRSLGISSVMLTGDSAAAATYAQSQLGNILEEVHSELLPEGKVRIIDELKAKHGPTLMIGDGMNDAPALAKADVGVSMGVSGSAVAMETSHITLMSNDIRKIPKAIRLARRTHRTIIVNILFSVMTKLAILALAFAGHPILWAAVLADVGTCLVVIMYSMLLLREKNTKKAKKCCSSSHHRSDAKKHVAANHCSDRSCKSTVHCKEPHNSHSSASQQGCHDHDHDHNHRQEPNNSRSSAIEHGCHDHDHDHNHEHNHCQQPNNSHSAASKDACHDHDHDHDHCKEPSSLHPSAAKHSCHDHDNDHDHDHCKEPSSLHPSAAKHSCHDHDNDHDHCKEPSTSHTTEDHACHGHDHDHDHDHDHEYCRETQALHNPDEHACHDHVEVKQPYHHSHCCHEQVKDTSNASPEHSISITAPPDHHEQHSQCSHHDQEHREEGCGDHLKAKNDAPPPTNCGGGSSKCCSKNASKACSSLQIAGAGQCCRRYKKGGGRRSRCCSHGIVKLPEIVVE